MLQKTFIASMVQPWLGSIQYSPAVKIFLFSTQLCLHQKLLITVMHCDVGEYINLNTCGYKMSTHFKLSTLSFTTIRQTPLGITHHFSNQGGRVLGLYRYELDSSLILQGYGYSQFGCWETWVWHQPRHHADAGFQMPGQPSRTWVDQDPYQSGPDQQRLTCRYQGQGPQKDQEVRGYPGDPERKGKNVVLVQLHVITKMATKTVVPKHDTCFVCSSLTIVYI